jgi:hypothetical protein
MIVSKSEMIVTATIQLSIFNVGFHPPSAHL